MDRREATISGFKIISVFWNYFHRVLSWRRIQWMVAKSKMFSGELNINNSPSQWLRHRWLISSHHEVSGQNCPRLWSDEMVFISTFVCAAMTLARTWGWPGHRWSLWSLAMFSHSTVSPLSSLAMSPQFSLSLSRTSYYMMCEWSGDINTLIRIK